MAKKIVRQKLFFMCFGSFPDFFKNNWKNLVKISGDGRPEILTKFFSRPKWLKKLSDKNYFSDILGHFQTFSKKNRKNFVKISGHGRPEILTKFFSRPKWPKKVFDKNRFSCVLGHFQTFSKKNCQKIVPSKKIMALHPTNISHTPRNSTPSHQTLN